jgi:hypothetical protein
MAASGVISATGDPRKVDVAGDTMTGPLLLEDGQEAVSTQAVNDLSDSVTTELANRLQLTGGTLIGSLFLVGGNLMVIRADEAGGFGVRVDGGAVDYDFGPADIVIGHWDSVTPEGGFAGGQTQIMRWRGNGVTMVGLEIGGNVYGSTHELYEDGIGFFDHARSAQQTVTGATDAQKVASIIALLQAYGLSA